MSAPRTYAEALAHIVRLLEPRAGASASAEAERILITAARVAGGAGGRRRDEDSGPPRPGDDPLPLTRLDLYSRTEISGDVAAEAERLARERLGGRLLQHVTGTQAFLEHDYRVNEAVLIPRPETEILVTAAIETLHHPGRDPQRGLEMGLGSGIISIELLAAFPALRMTASEVSPEAVAVASANAAAILGDTARLEIVRPRSAHEVWEPFRLSSQMAAAAIATTAVAAAIDSRADFIISNPPYLVKADFNSAGAEAEPDVAAQEPALALWAPEGDPLFFYREIAERAPTFLQEEGYVFLELAHERAAQTRALFSDEVWEVEVRRDLNDRERVLIGKLRGRKPSASARTGEGTQS